MLHLILEQRDHIFWTGPGQWRRKPALPQMLRFRLATAEPSVMSNLYPSSKRIVGTMGVLDEKLPSAALACLPQRFMMASRLPLARKRPSSRFAPSRRSDRSHG